jgi:hypothetical protein
MRFRLDYFLIHRFNGNSMVPNIEEYVIEFCMESKRGVKKPGDCSFRCLKIKRQVIDIAVCVVW